MAIHSLEERVAALEKRMKQIEHQQDGETAADAPRGWQRFIGAFQNAPDFDEAVRVGREWREAQHPLDGEKTP